MVAAPTVNECSADYAKAWKVHTKGIHNILSYPALVSNELVLAGRHERSSQGGSTE